MWCNSSPWNGSLHRAVLIGAIILVAVVAGCAGGSLEPAQQPQQHPDAALQFPAVDSYPAEFRNALAALPADVELLSSAGLTPALLPASCPGGLTFDGTSGWVRAQHADTSNPHNLLLQPLDGDQATGAAWAVYGFALEDEAPLELRIAATLFGPAGLGIAVRTHHQEAPYAWMPLCYATAPDPVVELPLDEYQLLADGALQVVLICPTGTVASITELTVANIDTAKASTAGPLKLLTE